LPRRRDEPVRLTRIYTRGGDAGETSLGDGSRVSKLDPLIRGYGAVDELNSLIGWVLVAAPDERLVRVQNELFDLGADLSVPFVADDARLRVSQDAIDRLERDCDEANAPLPELRSFCPAGAKPPHACTSRGRCAGVRRAWCSGLRPSGP
jgi:cob(I)alamin adenosyltransferase